MNNTLNCRDTEIEVTPYKPFANDMLNRERFASTLDSVVELYSDTGCVLSLNGEWGSGKTTFVRMWRQHLIDNGFKTLYFNAWKTDFLDDALTALLGELKDEFPNNEHIKSIVAKGAKLSLCVTEAIINGFLHKVTGIKAEALSAAVSSIKEQFADSVESYAKRKSDLEDFKQSLSELVASESNGKPVVFFIDELDRCKPNYAVQVLERVKHLFEVPNIVFIVAVNEDQLQYAVQGFYGSCNINGKEYLRRFFDITITLPTPNLFEYAKTLYRKHNFESFFRAQQEHSHSNSHRDEDYFIGFAGDILTGSNMNLRLANKIFAYTRLALYGFPYGTTIRANTFFLLCYIKETNSDLFNALKSGVFSIQGLVSELENKLPDGIFSKETDLFTPHHIAWAIAELIVYYSYSDRGIKREPNFKGTKTENDNLPNFPIITNKIDKSLLDEALSHIMNYEIDYMHGLKHIIEKIELNINLTF